MRLPRKTTINHIRQEKSERAVQRLKLKTGSLLIKLHQIIRSVKEAIEKNTTPKIKPSTNPEEVGRNGRIVRSPPSTHKVQSKTKIFL